MQIQLRAIWRDEYEASMGMPYSFHQQMTLMQFQLPQIKHKADFTTLKNIH